MVQHTARVVTYERLIETPSPTDIESTRAATAAVAPVIGPADTSVKAPVVRIMEPRTSAWASVRDAWRYRGWIPWFGARVLVKRIAGTKLGWLWLLIRPLVDTLGKALIFGAVLQIAAPNAVPYFVFLLAGMTTWRFFERWVFQATRSFDQYSKLMKGLKFPLLLVPFSAGAYPLVEASVYFLVFAGAIVTYLFIDGILYLRLSPDLLVAAAGLALALVSAWGVGLWVSVLNAKARDWRYIMRYVLEIWLYLTPVVYPLSAVPPSIRTFALLNPLTAPIEMVKLGLLGAGRVETVSVLSSLSFVVLMVSSGLWFFTREAMRSIDLHGASDEEEE